MRRSSRIGPFPAVDDSVRFELGPQSRIGSTWPRVPNKPLKPGCFHSSPLKCRKLGKSWQSEVWAVFEYFGTAHFKGYIQQSIDQADWLRARIDEHPAYEQPVTTQFGLVCLCSVHGDETTKFLCEHLQGHGFGVLSSVLRGTVFLRIALGSPLTEQVHIEALWQSMVKFAEEVP